MGVIEETSSATPEPLTGRRRWMLFVWLIVLSVALEGAEILAAPFLHITVTAPLVVEVLGAAALLAAAGAGIGLWLGPSLGWDILGLRGWRRGGAIAVGAGLVMGAAQAIFAARFLVTLGLNLTLPPLWLGVIGGLAGAFREEIIFRMGLMTLLTWLGVKLFRQKRPSAALVWTANILTAIVFGAMHYSSDSAQVSGAISPQAFAALVITYHGLAGLLFGWLYWRRGTLAAVAGHFTTDLTITLLSAIPGFIA
jgi:membrane protease YdiL (CAAX protease family)